MEARVVEPAWQMTRKPSAAPGSDGVGSIRTEIVIIGEVVDRHDGFICRMDHLFEGAIGACDFFAPLRGIGRRDE